MTDITEAPVSLPVADLEDDGLLGTFHEGRRLVGTKCGSCGRVMIGARVVCSSCVSRDVVRVALPASGVLYSFTRVHVVSKHSASKVTGGAGVRPVGYVDLDAGGGSGAVVRTLADLREGDVPLRPDQPVELGTDGDDWFFTPTGDRA